MTRWGEPREESWASALIAWAAYLIVAVGLFIAITAR